MNPQSLHIPILFVQLNPLPRLQTRTLRSHITLLIRPNAIPLSPLRTRKLAPRPRRRQRNHNLRRRLIPRSMAPPPGRARYPL